MSHHLNPQPYNNAGAAHHFDPKAGWTQPAHRVPRHPQFHSAASANHPTNYNHNNNYDHQPDQYQDNEAFSDENIDVQLDSPESDYQGQAQGSPSKSLPDAMSEELKLDLTCFQDDEVKKKPVPGGVSLMKRGEQRIIVNEEGVVGGGSGGQYPLSMKPRAGSKVVDSTEPVASHVDRSQTEPPREVVSSLAGDTSVTALPPINKSETLPIPDSNGRLTHNSDDTGRPPIRRSVTPNEFGGDNRPSVVRRAATPSKDFADSNLLSKGRRRKDVKSGSTENLDRCVDDVALSASKKKHFRTSLKNLFQRKK